jgi:hypothetical protein
LICQGWIIKDMVLYDKDWAVLFYWSIHYSNVLPPNLQCVVFLHHWLNRKTFFLDISSYIYYGVTFGLYNATFNNVSLTSKLYGSDRGHDSLQQCP